MEALDFDDGDAWLWHRLPPPPIHEAKYKYNPVLIEGHKKKDDQVKKGPREDTTIQARNGTCLLVRLVQQYGIRRWSHVAQLLNGRIGKQCRERWFNHLSPDIKKDTWSDEEDKVLIQAHSEIGNKWAEIAKRLPGRTENSIKNRWNATKRRLFSHRSWQSSKYPRSGSLLQNYIKSVTIASTLPTSVLTTEEQNSTCNEEWKGVVASSSTPPMNGIGNATTEIGHLSNTCLAPACHFNDAPDLLEKKNMHEMYDDMHLFDQLECGYMDSSSESSKDFEMAMTWDAAIPMASSSESSKDFEMAMPWDAAIPMASSSESSKDFEMAMAWDAFEMAMAWDAAIPMASSSESSKDFEMAMTWDAAIPMASSNESSKDFEKAMAWDAAIPPLMMPTSSENVNREMDLMEMIAQNNSLLNTF